MNYSPQISSTSTGTTPLDRIASLVSAALERDSVALLPPMDVLASMDLIRQLQVACNVTMLDPWYNKGFGGVRDDYDDFIDEILSAAAIISPHVFFWGFPEIVARFVTKIPAPLGLNTWLTWYYKNNPSVIRGWRSAQNACLHLTSSDAKLHPEHFLNEKQLELRLQGKLRYMPGPTSVIEAALLVGFVGKKEQTGHPSQKPVAVYDPLVKMSCVPGDLVFDPMAGSGTTGAVARAQGVHSILCDISEDFTALIEQRLSVSRLPVEADLKALGLLSP